MVDFVLVLKFWPTRATVRAPKSLAFYHTDSFHRHEAWTKSCIEGFLGKGLRFQSEPLVNSIAAGSYFPLATAEKPQSSQSDPKLADGKNGKCMTSSVET